MIFSNIIVPSMLPLPNKVELLYFKGNPDLPASKVLFTKESTKDAPYVTTRLKSRIITKLFLDIK